MKSFIIALSLCLTVPAFAASPDGGGAAGHAVSADDAAKIRDGVKAIGQAFGVTPAQTITAPAPAAPQKSMADIADKALDMFGGLVANVSNTLEKIAPHVWRIMIRQQYAKAVADIAVPLLLLLLTGFYVVIMRSLWKKPEKDWGFSWGNENIAWFWLQMMLPGVFGVIMFAWTAVAFSDAAKYIINPEYYAVKDILTMVLNPGAMQ